MHIPRSYANGWFYVFLLSWTIESFSMAIRCIVIYDSGKHFGDRENVPRHPYYCCPVCGMGLLKLDANRRRYLKFTVEGRIKKWKYKMPARLFFNSYFRWNSGLHGIVKMSNIKTHRITDIRIILLQNNIITCFDEKWLVECNVT